MLAGELKKLVAEFANDLRRHRDLWNHSLDDGLGLGIPPDYPVKNVEDLQKQNDSLLKQLGRLRPYLEELHSVWVLGARAAGVSWNILDMALGLHNGPQVKGPSLNALVDALQLVQGRLEDYDDQEEFRTGSLVTSNSDIELAERICTRLTKAARVLVARRAGKPSFEIKDEYDVQDLLHALFRAFLKYPVVENPLPKPAGAVSSRADLSVSDLGLIVEAKFVRSERDQARIEKELSTDLVFYSTWTPLKYLFFVIYNSADLQNAELLEKFSKPQTINEKHFAARVINV